MTDYQKRVEKIIKNPRFQEFYNKDKELSTKQKILEAALLTQSQLNQEETKKRIDEIKKQRRQLLNEYLQTKK